MPIPTGPIGSVPRPRRLIEGMREAAAGRLSAEQLESLCDAAVRDTIREFEATGSPVITDDCGFSPFGDDTSTSRETAFAQIRSRVEGTQLGPCPGLLSLGAPKEEEP